MGDVKEKGKEMNQGDLRCKEVIRNEIAEMRRERTSAVSARSE